MIDIKKSRELLGKKGEAMTDEEIIKVEERLTTLANLIIDRVLEDRNKKTLNRLKENA